MKKVLAIMAASLALFWVQASEAAPPPRTGETAAARTLDRAVEGLSGPLAGTIPAQARRRHGSG
jgi:hypothetical protein